MVSEDYPGTASEFLQFHWLALDCKYIHIVKVLLLGGGGGGGGMYLQYVVVLD